MKRMQTKKMMSGASVWLAVVMILTIVMFLPQQVDASVIFEDNFSTGGWQDSDQIEGFWSRSQGSGTSIGTEDGRFKQTFTSASNNRSAIMFSQNQEMFNFANQQIVIQYNDFEEIMVEEFLGGANYNYRKAFGVTANPGERLDGGMANVISFEQHFRMFNDGTGAEDHTNTFRLRVGTTTLDSHVQYMSGPPVESSRNDILLLKDAELVIGPTTVTAKLYFHNGDAVTLSGSHGLDPLVDVWMADPALGIQGFASRADTDSSNPSGFFMGSLVVIPEPSTMVMLGLAGLLLMKRRRY